MTSRLFVPLHSIWYDLFKNGKKTVEVRGRNNQFNNKTVWHGRPVELRRGYAKEGALWGTIGNIHYSDSIYHLPLSTLRNAFPLRITDERDDALYDWIDKYNRKYPSFIAFEVILDEI